MGILGLQGSAPCSSRGKMAETVAPLTTDELTVFKADFKEFDANTSGFLCMKELPGLLQKQLQRSLSVEEVKVVFNAMDLNGDGFISFSEYMTHMAGASWRGYASMDGEETSAAADPGQEQAAVKIQCAFRVKKAKKEVKKKKLTKKQRQEIAAERKQKKLDDEAEIQEIMAQLEKESIERRQGEKDYIASLHK